MPKAICSVPGCISASYGPIMANKNFKFHRIGKFRALAWTKAIKRHDLLEENPDLLNYKYVCSLHFEDYMYTDKERKTLRKYAKPTLKLPIEYDYSPKVPKVSQHEMKQNTPKKKDTDDHKLNRKASEIVIKYEPPESSEITIEPEQIGFQETAKRQRLVDSSKDSEKVLIPKDEPLNDDNQVGHNLTMYNKHEHCHAEDPSTLPVKVESTDIEYDDSIVENKALTNNSLETHVPVTTKKKLKKLMRYTNKYINKSKTKNMKQQKKEAHKRFLLGCDIYLSPKLSSIIKKQFKSKGDQFTADYKMFCFHLFMSSPTTYKFFSQILCLPSKKDLIKTYFPIDSNINKNVLSILSELCNKMSLLEKECVLTFGEIKLKKSLFYDGKADRVFGLHEIGGLQKACVGCYAYTIMLNGLASDWKLLIGFSFTLLNELNVGFTGWLAETIAQLFQIGYNVRAVRCPVLPAFTQLAANMTEVSQNVSYFEVMGKKVYFLFDIKSILKSARNALMRNILIMNDRKASWTCVRQLYKVDHNQSNRLAPQLTEVHIKLKKHHQKRSRYASQIIDTSVAVALNVYADKEYLKPFYGTIQFIYTMRKVYDMLKSDKPVSFSNEEKQFLEKARELFSSISVRNKKNVVVPKVMFKDAISFTLNSISHLSDDMQSENLVVTRSTLTNSCMQPFYDVMRKLSGHSKRVTCREYLRAFRRCFMFYALKTVEIKDKTLTDSTAFLAEFEKYVRKNKIYQTTKHKQSRDILSEFLNTSEENRFIYVYSYILQKCVEKHTCPKLMQYVNSHVRASNSEENEITGLRVPPDHFLIFCTNLENYLEYSFHHNMNGNIFKNLTKKLKQLYFDKPCKCFPVDFLLGMFVKMRIKYNNMLHNRQWKENSGSVSNTVKFIRM